MGIFDFISGIIKPVTDLIDSLTTTDEEKLTLRNKFMEVTNTYNMKVVELESQIVDAKSKIIIAEAQGQSWLQRSWRPLVMIWFCILLGLYWFGVAPDYLVSNPALVDSLFTLLKIGIGGYIGGRTAEKIADKLKDKK